MDDSALAVKAAAGDHGAFAELLDRHGGRVLAVAARITRDRNLAEDLCQDVWLHLLRVLPRYDPARPFLPWLLHVAANLCRNRVRGERRRPAGSLDALAADGGEFAGASVPAPGDKAERDEIAAIVRAARDRLPESYRSILALRYEGDLSHEEIAEALGGLPIGTVKNRLHRAREALALQLEETLGRREP
jgi:RNA polymerase sigma-70 factor (ECF subfamily)